MRSKYSGKHFVRCYPCERQQALFDGHIQAFSFFGGVFPVLIYDNLTTAVQKVLRGKKRVLQESYDKFRGYYNFTPRFCNPGQGHEKGGVEGLVGYARRNYMVPVPEAESLEELNKKLLQDCLSYGNHRIAGREQTVNELYETEKKHLIALPDIPFSNLETSVGRWTNILRLSSIKIGIRYRPSMPILRSMLFCMWIVLRYFMGAKKLHLIYGFTATTNGAFCRNIILNSFNSDHRHLTRRVPYGNGAKAGRCCLERLLDRFCQKQGNKGHQGVHIGFDALQRSRCRRYRIGC